MLFNVLVDPETRSSMIDVGVLYAIMKISRLENTEIHQICVQVVYRVGPGDIAYGNGPKP